MTEMEFDGLIISVLVNTKEQYEKTRAEGTIGSMAIREEDIPTCNYDPLSIKYNVPKVRQAINECTKMLTARILNHMIEKEKLKENMKGEHNGKDI